ncbi:hypothetical protein FD06_GL000708 [Apilactobacillus ozensis DSM 23829 = JCM 17196]|uniref:ABM domain-containing protein n=1 Tax=Apilactobacillus ozensis DSM 23829 = JCM 17196 TaxID=1423781 RepID=A0A0R2ALK9_9LACO|nr:antibiotic biosynthesis monooxygenase [Apilactobacillus ozensis]KRM67557.1 hypothetical protein FD06_GL000708 [Apilactobacillus ozensis DSM 23829 = JCM 17196]
MSLVINIYYKGNNGSAYKFYKDMINSGLVQKVRNEPGNIKYDYFSPINDSETLLLIDEWKTADDLDAHHKSNMMSEIAHLRDKYKLSMHVEMFTRHKN